MARNLPDASTGKEQAEAELAQSEQTMGRIIEGLDRTVSYVKEDPKGAGATFANAGLEFGHEVLSGDVRAVGKTAATGISLFTGGALGKLGKVRALADDLGIASRVARRERILANIGKSRAARQSSKIDVLHVKAVQIESGYNADRWIKGNLRQGNVIYALSPNPKPQFFTNLEALQAGRFNSASVSQAVQVKEHIVFGYRPDVTGFRVRQDFSPMQGQALANPQFGPGGADQFFIDKLEKYLDPITTIDLNK